MSWVGFLGLLALGLTACGRNEIRVYRIPKEKTETNLTSEAGGVSQPPSIKWKLPQGWEEKPASGMRAATLVVAGKDGQNAEVAVIQMPGLAARDAEVVNLWREQLGLEPLSPEAVALKAEKVAIGETQGQLFDMVSKGPMIDEKYPARVVVAMMTREGAAWFFKMSGRDELLAEQKPVFVQFLKSIQFESGGKPVPLAGNHPVSTNVKELPHRDADRPSWQVPASWQEQPATQMLLAKFVAVGKEGSKAEVTISSFPGEVGGLLANVNRWRSQVGLAPVNQEEISKIVSPLDVSADKAMLVDMTGQDPDSGQKSRLIGAILPKAGRTWFFKIKGDEPVVAQEKEAFIQFLKSLRFPHG